VLAFAALYFRWFMKQSALSANAFEDWGHAFIVPAISAAYVWTIRDRIARAPAVVYWPGLALLVLGSVCYAYFLVGFPNHMFQGFSMILGLAGAVLLLAGPHVFKHLVFPLAYLGLGVTISQQVMLAITFRLQTFASYGAWVLLNLFTVDVELEGNILRVANASGEVFPLNVAEACSGMRMVVAFVALAAAVAFFSCRQWWQRAAVIMLSVPVALLMNVLRVAVLAALTLVDPELSVGEAHSLIGTLLLIPAFGLFMLVVWALKTAAPEVEPGEASGASVSGKRGGAS
jgi:exosortase